jgi:hypothetical protein
MMFSKTIKYKDFNGKDQEKVFWFHLSNAKLAMLSADGNLKTWAESMMKQQDPVQILDKIRYLVKLACGIRSDDGQRFIQTEAAQSELLDSPAFDELLFELFVADNASKFFTALVPEDQQKQIEALAIKQGVSPDQLKLEDSMPVYQREHRRPTAQELQNMSKEDLQEAFAWTQQNLPNEVQK